ncbi:MAG: hypothetical protein ACF8SC_03165 [Phycisphaerales bacterium JB037]
MLHEIMNSSTASLTAGASDNLIPIISIIGGFVFTAFIIGVSAIKSTRNRRQLEESRREIAAYVAEGSMTAEEGERLLRAERPDWERRGCK